MSEIKGDAPGHQMVINSQLSSLFMIINAVVVALITSIMIWSASTLHTLSTQVAVLISQNEEKENEHSRFDRRITVLERDRSAINRFDYRDKQTPPLADAD